MMRNYRRVDEQSGRKMHHDGTRQYMWLHRRFKTRPEGVPSRFKSPLPDASEWHPALPQQIP